MHLHWCPTELLDLSNPPDIVPRRPKRPVASKGTKGAFRASAPPLWKFVSSGRSRWKTAAPWSSRVEDQWNHREILTTQTSKRLGSVKVEHAIFFFFLRVPLFHLDSTITFQPSIVDPGWPRCFGRAPQLPASATVLRDANEFVAQIFQEMPIIRGISKREFVRLPWAIAFMPSVSIRFLPSFSSRHPYTNLLPSNSSHHLLTKNIKNQNGIIGRNIEMQNNDIQTNDPKHVAPKKSEKRKQNHL